MGSRSAASFERIEGASALHALVNLADLNRIDMTRLFLSGATILCWLVSGCQVQSYKGAKRYPLSGKVTVNGEPLDAGNISFLPEAGEQRVSGGVITDGAYHVSEADGANAGNYRVEIHWHRKTGRKFRDSDLGIMVDERKEGLPEQFHTKSKLRAEVSDKQTTFDFDLKLP